MYNQVGFGKGTNSKQLWVDGIEAGTSRQQLEKHMSKYGKVGRINVLNFYERLYYP